MNKYPKKECLSIFLVLSLLSAALYINARQLPSGGALGYGSNIMPTIMAVVLMCCSIGFLAEGLMAPKTEGGSGKWDPSSTIRLVAATAMLVVYVLLLRSVGFVIMTALYIFLQSQLMVPAEKRSYLISGILAVVVSLSVYLIFSKGLSMTLPAGILRSIF